MKSCSIVQDKGSGLCLRVQEGVGVRDDAWDFSRLGGRTVGIDPDMVSCFGGLR